MKSLETISSVVKAVTRKLSTCLLYCLGVELPIAASLRCHGLFSSSTLLSSDIIMRATEF